MIRIKYLIFKNTESNVYISLNYNLLKIVSIIYIMCHYDVIDYDKIDQRCHVIKISAIFH